MTLRDADRAGRRAPGFAGYPAPDEPLASRLPTRTEGGSPADNPETAKLAAELATAAMQLDRKRRALQAKFDAAAAELARQLKAKNAGSVDVTLKLVAKPTEQAESLLPEVAEAREWSASVAEDEAYLGAHLKVVTRLTAMVDATETAIVAMTKKSRALEVAAEAFRDTGKVTEKEGELELSRLHHNNRIYARSIQAGLTAAQKALADAQKAQAQRDAAALEQAKAAVRNGFDEQKDNLADIDTWFPRLQKDWIEKAPGADARKRRESELADAAKEQADNRKGPAEWAARIKDADAIRIAGVDAAKAAAALDLDARHKAELAKALQGDDAQMTRNLDAMLKKLELAGSGREMLARLRKARQV